jgi:hypothetical protein
VGVLAAAGAEAQAHHCARSGSSCGHAEQRVLIGSPECAEQSCDCELVVACIYCIFAAPSLLLLMCMHLGIRCGEQRSGWMDSFLAWSLLECGEDRDSC